MRNVTGWRWPVSHFPFQWLPRALFIAVLCLAVVAGCGDDSASPQCGDGVAEGDESCDGSDLRGHDCTTVDRRYIYPLWLGCREDCTFDTSGCTVATCGNGILEPGEECDGYQTGELTCEGLGFTGGSLACREGCELDLSGCTLVESTCGDGVVEGYESCDGTDLLGATCESISPRYVGGVLACTVSCAFETSGCLEATCGDGVAEGLERCDGADLGGITCADIGLYTRGSLACTPECVFDTSGCLRDPACGNGVAEPGEACDSADLRGRDCGQLGFAGGALGCGPGCRFDVSGCLGDLCALENRYGDGLCDDCVAYGGSADPDCALCAVANGSCSPPDQLDPFTGGSTCQAATGARDPDCGTCGDGSRSDVEACDGVDLGNASCRTEGFDGGSLSCTASCALDLSACEGLCGDGRKDPGERCDGTDLGGASCASLGLGQGALGCMPDCSYDVWACSDVTIFGICGDGFVGGTELCDGQDLFGETCESHGFDGGVLLCAADCTFDFAGCRGDRCANIGMYGDGQYCDLCELYGSGPDPDCAALCGLADGLCLPPDYPDPLLGVSTCLIATGSSDPDCGFCGDGVASSLELCDGADLGGLDCTHVGASGGTLACTPGCELDPSGCF